MNICCNIISLLLWGLWAVILLLEQFIRLQTVRLLLFRSSFAYYIFFFFFFKFIVLFRSLTHSAKLLLFFFHTAITYWRRQRWRHTVAMAMQYSCYHCTGISGLSKRFVIFSVSIGSVVLLLLLLLFRYYFRL